MANGNGIALLLIGLLALGVGIVMPAEQTKTVGKCMEDRSIGNCGDQWYYEVEKEVDNKWKVPTMVGGGILALVGLSSMGGGQPPRRDDRDESGDRQPLISALAEDEYEERDERNDRQYDSWEERIEAMQPNEDEKKKDD
jgi:hypothetical protein